MADPISEMTLKKLVDEAVKDPRGLRPELGMSTLKVVMKQAALRLSAPELLERIKHSGYQRELLMHVPKVLGREHKTLTQCAAALRANTEGWEPEALRLFADLYWQMFVRRFILRRTYRQAWVNIRRSFCGLGTQEPSDKIPPRGGAQQLAASPEVVRGLLDELFAHMNSRGLLNPALMAPGTRPNMPHPAGYGFACALGGTKEGESPKGQEKVFALADFFSVRRTPRRMRKGGCNELA